MKEVEEYLKAWKEFCDNYFKGMPCAPYKHEIQAARREFQKKRNEKQNKK
tara:strand:+ start:33 stop:182 length:150 start_codon:yes stop_codon:yes gene_type:complete